MNTIKFAAGKYGTDISNEIRMNCDHDSTGSWYAGAPRHKVQNVYYSTRARSQKYVFLYKTES